MIFTRGGYSLKSMFNVIILVVVFKRKQTSHVAQQRRRGMEFSIRRGCGCKRVEKGVNSSPLTSLIASDSQGTRDVCSSSEKAVTCRDEVALFWDQVNWGCPTLFPIKLYL